MSSTQAQTAADLVRLAAPLTHDSLRPRAAPSVELERTARYVAGEFERFGLRPGGVDGNGAPSWFQRYPVAGRRQLDPTHSEVVVQATLMARAKPIVSEVGWTLQREFPASLATAAYLTAGTEPVPTQDIEDSRPTVLVAGPHTAASLRQANLRGANVLYVPPMGSDAAQQAEVRQQLRVLGHGLVVLGSADSVTFATHVQAARQRPPRLADDYLWQQSTAGWTAEVWPGTLVTALAAAGVDLAEIRSTTAAVVRPLPALQVRLQVQENAAQPDTATLPNVIGRLDGTDSTLWHSPLIISAHLDHTGLQDGRADTLAAAADHDAAEVAALLALAQAFSRSGVRPLRSVVFLAASGGGPGAYDWGTNYYLTTWGYLGRGMGANLALEHLEGAPGGDTLVIAGTEEMDLPHPLSWLLGAHPELGVTLAEESAEHCPPVGCWSTRSVFAQAKVAALEVGIGSVTADTRTAEHAARTLRFAYYLADDLANAPTVPRWNAKVHEQLTAKP